MNVIESQGCKKDLGFLGLIDFEVVRKVKKGIDDKSKKGTAICCPETAAIRFNVDMRHSAIHKALGQDEILALFVDGGRQSHYLYYK